MDIPNLLDDLLRELKIPHTRDFPRRSFDSMPFKSWFGLTSLLREYGVGSTGCKLGSLRDMEQLHVPFLAATQGGTVIVTSVRDGRIHYLTQGVSESVSVDMADGAFSGEVLLLRKSPGAAEPDYCQHRRTELCGRAKDACLVICAVFLFLYLVVSNGLYRHVSTVLLVLLDLAGLYLSFMLVQKSLKIHNPHADAVCRILDEGGCDSILETKASTFFGIFGWSEVGLAYFSVSLLCLLVFPQWTGCLALCNLCCLPFSFWSIWYQKVRARKWCTLCVSVQATLWALFFCYLGGGFLRDMFPVRIELFVLGAAYMAALLAVNRVSLLINDKNG